MIKDYYKILNVSFSASQSEIKKAFRKLAVFWHPDKNSNPDSMKRMQEINEAYEILSNSIKRETYNKIYQELYGTTSDIAVYKETYQTNFNEEKRKEKEQTVKEKYSQEINDLNNWIRSIKFSLDSIDGFLNRTIAKVDRPIENFVYYLPFVFLIIFIVLVLIANIT